jgi:hypothetical protein
VQGRYTNTKTVDYLVVFFFILRNGQMWACRECPTPPLWPQCSGRPRTLTDVALSDTGWTGDLYNVNPNTRVYKSRINSTILWNL